MRVALCFLVAFFVTAQPSLPPRGIGTSTLKHGHLVPLPFFVDRDGLIVPGSRYSFLAVRLEFDPVETLPVDYIEGGISRRVFTDESLDRWLILPIGKSCAPVLVCAPYPWSYGKDACLTSSLPHLFAGVPIGCPQELRRRAVRK